MIHAVLYCIFWNTISLARETTCVVVIVRMIFHSHSCLTSRMCLSLSWLNRWMFYNRLHSISIHYCWQLEGEAEGEDDEELFNLENVSIVLTTTDLSWDEMRFDEMRCHAMYCTLYFLMLWCVCIYTSRQWTLLEWKVNRGGWPDIYYFPDNVEDTLTFGWRMNNHGENILYVIGISVLYRQRWLSQMNESLLY